MAMMHIFCRWKEWCSGDGDKKGPETWDTTICFCRTEHQSQEDTAGVLFSVRMGHIWSTYISRKDPCRPIGLLIFAVSACLWAFECDKLYKNSIFWAGNADNRWVCLIWGLEDIPTSLNSGSHEMGMYVVYFGWVSKIKNKKNGSTCGLK